MAPKEVWKKKKKSNGGGTVPKHVGQLLVQLALPIESELIY